MSDFKTKIFPEPELEFGDNTIILIRDWGCYRRARCKRTWGTRSKSALLAAL